MSTRRESQYPMQNSKRNRIQRWIVAGSGVAIFGYALVVVGSWGMCSWHMQSGSQALVKGDFELARVRLQVAESWSESDAGVQFLLARVERHREQFSEMESRLALAARMGWPEVSIARERILAEAQSGQPQQVAPRLSQLLDQAETSEEFGEICEAYVRGYKRQTDFARALQLLKSWESRQPLAGSPHLLRAAIRRELQQFPEAAEEFQLVLDRVPDQKEARLGLADVLLQQGLVGQAVPHFRRYLELEPDNLSALLGLADCLFGKGELDEAARLYDRALESDPELVSARRGIGRIALQEGRPEEALAWLKPAAKLAPYDTAIQYNLGLALRATGDLTAAAEYFEAVAERHGYMAQFKSLVDHIQRNSDDVSARYELGMLILEHFEPEKCLVWFQSVLLRAPHHEPTHRALSDYYGRTDQPELAAFHRTQLVWPKQNLAVE